MKSYAKLSTLLLFALIVSPLLIVVKKSSENDYLRFINSHPFHPDNTRSLDLTTIPKQDRPDLAWEQDYLRTLNPKLQRPTPEKLIETRQQVRSYFHSKKAAKAGTSEYPFIERGPNNVGGRTRALMWDPNDVTQTKVWAGGVTGGLWYNDDIYDNQEPWVNVDDFWANIAITCIASDPNNSNIFYVGTGETYTGSTRGAGIWKSTDGGVSWSQLSSTQSYYYINDIVVRDESGSSVVYAAVDGRYYNGVFHSSAEAGLQRSVNGGTSWTQVLPNVPGETINFVASDIELSANNRLWVGTRRSPYAATDRGGARILFSDNGTSWTTSYSTAVTNGSGRVELACAPSENNVVYGIVENDSEIHLITKTTNNGGSWDDTVPEPNDADPGISSDDFSRGQAWYDLILSVNPSDANDLYAGGIDLFKSENAGTNWEQISHWYGGFGEQYVHADQHQIVFKPGSSTDALFGNDGGVYLSTDMDATNPTIEARNKNYNVTQFYAGAMHPDEGSDYYLAGTQDNGTQQFSKSGLADTYEATGGDGAFTFIDQLHPNVQITSYVYNSYYLSTNGGQSFSNFVSDQSSGSFINPADYDNQLGILYSNAGSSEIGRWTGLREGNPVRNDISISLGGSATALRVSEYTKSSTTLFVGNSIGQLRKITNAEGSHSSSTLFDNNFGSISCIELGESEDEIIITFFNYGVNSVWYTSDGGSSWDSKEGDLPDMPIRWALFNPNNREEVLLATELGVWRTVNFSNSSPTWVSSNEGLANVRVDMLQIRESDHQVAAFTHGRGAFTSFGFSESSDKKADFTASATSIGNGESVTFTDLSLGDPVAWDWSFENGTPLTSTDQNPTVTYSGSNGANDVTLTVTYSNGVQNTKTSEGMINIVPSSNLPNIRPYNVSTWDDAITIYSTFDDFENDASVSTTDQIYFAFAIINDGDASLETSFTIKVVLDGNTVLYDFTQTRSAGDPLDVGFYTYYSNVDNTTIQNLGAGLHSLELILDEANTVAESDDSDNSYTRYFFIDDAASPAIVWDGIAWSNVNGPTTNISDNIVFLDDYVFKNNNPGPGTSEFIAVGDVTILGNTRVTIDESINFQANGTIESDGEIIVKPGGSLFSLGDFTNNGEVLVESGGSFSLSGSSVFGGNDITIQRDTRYPDGRYSFVGSPMKPQASLSGAILGTDVYKYDESIAYGSNQGLSKWINASSDQLEAGRGYTQASQKRLTFVGEPNQGAITYTGSYTTDDGLHEGFNLVANPYATAILVAEFLNVNTNLEGAIYLWDDNGSDVTRGSNADYIVANGLAATNTTPAGGEVRYNTFLGSTQGFFVKLSSNSDLGIDFTESMQASGRNYDNSFFKQEDVPLLRLNLTNHDGLFRQCVIGLVPDADMAMKDRRYDAPAFSPLAENALFTIKNGERLAIQGVPLEWKSIPLQLNVGTKSTEYSISLEKEHHTGDIYLLDKSTGELHHFLNGAYTFQSQNGMYDKRFEILSSAPLAANNGTDHLSIYSVDKKVYFRTSSLSPTSFSVINLNGQTVQNLTVKGNTDIDLSHLTSGFYLVSDGFHSFKILLK